MPKLTFRVSNGKEAAAVRLLFEFLRDIGFGILNSLVACVYITDDNVCILCQNTVRRWRNKDVSGIIPIRTKHYQAIAERQLRMSNATLAIGNY